MTKPPSVRRLINSHFTEIICLTFAVTMACGAVSKTATVNATNRTQSRVAVAVQGLQRYRSSHSLSDLKSTLYSLQAAIDVSSLTPDNFIESRRSLVNGWAQLLRAIETSYDSTFDPTQHFSCPEPDRQPDGTQPMPCADPSVIQNPQERSAYAARLKEFHLKLNQAAHYQEVHNLDEGAMVTLSMGLDLLRKIAPSGAGADFAALDGILRQAGVSSERRSKIDAMIYAGPTP